MPIDQSKYSTIRVIKMIGAERVRQVADEGWSPEHDDEHFAGSLALAAACYASPVRLFAKSEGLNCTFFDDPWPWERKWDKRFGYGDHRENPGNTLPDPNTYNDEERIDLLVKAGALIAAEIERLLRKENSNEG